MQGRHHVGRGATAPKGFKEGKNEEIKTFHLLKEAFPISSTRRYILSKGFHDDFSTKTV